MKFTGEVTDLNGASSAEAFFVYWQEGEKSSSFQSAYGERVELTSTGAYSINVDDLKSGTTYVVKARARSSDGTWDDGRTVNRSTDVEKIAVSRQSRPLTRPTT
jgi:hypothetical protein